MNYLFKIDECDLDLASNYKWYLGKSPRSKGYFSTRKDGKTIYLHRLILGAKKGQIVDHINGDCWDNRRCNLRITDFKGNSINKSKHKNASSGFKGVSWHKGAKKWTASIGNNYKVINLGLFLTEEEAAVAWNKVALQLHGAFAKLNYV